MSASGAARRGNQRAAGERLGEQARNVGENIKGMGESVQDMAQEQFDRARQSAAEYYEQGREYFQDAEDSLEEYIRAQPLKSILIAVGIGYLIGKIF